MEVAQQVKAPLDTFTQDGTEFGLRYGAEIDWLNYHRMIAV